MPNQFAQLYAVQWPIMQAAFGESVTYTDCNGTTYAVTGIVTPRGDSKNLDATWEAQARQVEILIDADSLEGVTLSPRCDTITARGIVYTVIEMPSNNGAVYIFDCEREEVEAVRGRGRMY